MSESQSEKINKILEHTEALQEWEKRFVSRIPPSTEESLFGQWRADILDQIYSRLTTFERSHGLSQ